MNNKVIYTCISGSYDQIPQPSVVYDGYDYICFSNDIEGTKTGIWEIRKFPFTCKDKMRESRFVKLLPHEVLKEYTYSIYIDANLQIVDEELKDRIEQLISNDVKMASVLHPERNCLYDEARECVRLGRDTYFNIRKQILHLKSVGFPKNFGLYENNLIFRAHNNEVIKQISKDWWEQYSAFSRRDQLCLSYVFWKNNFIPELFLPRGISTHNYVAIKRLSHSIPSMKKRIRKRLSRNFSTLLMFIFGL